MVDLRPEAEPESDDARFQHYAADLIAGFFALLKIALVHRMDNKAVDPVVDRFGEALEQFQGEFGAEVAVQLVGDAVYVNRRLIRAELTTWEKARFLKKFFSRVKVAEVTFEEAMELDTLREFVQAMRDIVMDSADEDRIKKAVFKGIKLRDIDAQQGANVEALQVPDSLRVLRAYGLIVATIRDLSEKLAIGKMAPLVPIRRAFQEFVRLPESTRSLQLGVLSLEQFRDELSGRLGRLGVMVVMMGRRLDFSIAEVRDMGVAAALSGLGRGRHERLLCASPDACAREQVYLDGIKMLLPYSGRGRSTALRLIAAVEQGDPTRRRSGHPLSRLVAVADCYDLWTTKAPLGTGMRPDQAMTRLLTADDLDRVAARLLVATLGRYPVGTTVRLSSGEHAIVMDVTDDPRRLTEPRVMIVTDKNGVPCEGRMLDLIESGKSIKGTVDAAEMDLNVGHFIFA